MLFHVATPEAGFDVSPILTCQDESLANGVLTCPTDNGHDRYLYLYALDGNRKVRRLVRILKSKLESSYDTSDFSAYTCPTQWSTGPCDGTLPESWTSVLANATIVQFDQGTFGSLHSLSSAVAVPTDLAGTRSYVLVGKSCHVGGPCFAAAMTSPKPWGPWSLSTLAPPPDDDFFYYPILATYQLLADGHFAMGIAASARIAFPREGSPYFYQYDFQMNRLARNPLPEAAGVPGRGRPAAGGKLKLRYCALPGETACVPLSGLVSALEFAEPEGFDWNAPYPGAQQWFPRPYATNVVGNSTCMVTGGHDSNRQWQGTNTAGTRGWGMMLNSIYYGFRDKCVMYDGKGSDTVTAINSHSTPEPLTGDQDWTVVTVFKVSNTTANPIYSWTSINCAPPNYPPCASAAGNGGIFATASANLTDPTGQGKGNGSLGLMFDVAGGSLLGCCVGVATPPDQIEANNVYAVAYVKRAGAVTPATLNGPTPSVRIWRGAEGYSGTALTLYGGNNGGPPRTSPSNYFYFGWADSGGSSSVTGRHADVTYYYNLIYSRALSDSEWLRLYSYLKSALPQSPAGVVVQ
jgi:hypothetical protein